jgi:signal transduction histidine kinase
MRFRTWIVAALGLGSLLLLIIVSMLASSRKAQEIYVELDQLSAHHQNVEALLRRMRSDVNLSGIFVRDYLLDVARERAPEYRERISEFRRSNMATAEELLVVDAAQADRIRSLQAQLDDYWQTFEPLFDWTISEKIFRSASFLRREVVPRREAILGIAEEIEELNNANLATQRGEVARRQAVFRDDLRRLMWQNVLLGVVVAMVAVLRLRTLERRSEEQKASAQEAEQQIRQLAQERDAAQEEERRNLSRELHDHVAQVLTALRMELGRIDRARSAGDARVGAAAVAEARTLVDNMFRTVRDLALGLRPSMLDDFGLQSALEWRARDVTTRFGVSVDLQMEGDFDRLPDRYRTCVYRAVQEALTNCVRHAAAQTITVRVTGDGRNLDVSIIDDGIGFDASRFGAGLGLRGIMERVKELHGEMTIKERAEGGTTLDIRLPWPAEATEAPLARAAS